MKKTIIIIAFIAVSFGLKAQHYDTLIYKPVEIETCRTVFDTTLAVSQNFSMFNNYAYRYNTCPNSEYMGYYFGYIAGTSEYAIDGLAQPYFMDTTVMVIGVATQFEGGINGNNNATFNLYLQDTGFTTVYAHTNYKCVFDTSIHNPNGNPSSNKILGRFYFDTAINIQNFNIVADFPTLNTPGYMPSHFNHTLSNYDPTCLGNYVECYTGHSPYFRKNGVWTSFKDDYVYEIYSRMHIFMFPILAIKDNSSLGKEVESSIKVDIYPNPARDLLNISSSNTIKDIEIYNIIGQKLIEKNIQSPNSSIDISKLSKGNYIIKVNTEKGIVNKKFIIE